MSTKFQKRSGNFLEISRKFLKNSGKFLEISTNFLEISRNFLEMSKKFLENSGIFLEISRNFLFFGGGTYAYPAWLCREIWERTQTHKGTIRRHATYGHGRDAPN